MKLTKSKQFVFTFDLDDPYHMVVLEAFAALPRAKRVEALCNLVRSSLGKADAETIAATMKHLVYQPITSGEELPISDVSSSGRKLSVLPSPKEETPKDDVRPISKQTMRNLSL